LFFIFYLRLSIHLSPLEQTLPILPCYPPPPLLGFLFLFLSHRRFPRPGRPVSSSTAPFRKDPGPLFPPLADSSPFRPYDPFLFPAAVLSWASRTRNLFVDLAGFLSGSVTQFLAVFRDFSLLAKSICFHGKEVFFPTLDSGFFRLVGSLTMAHISLRR